MDLVLIDGNNTVHRCFHAMAQLQNSVGKYVGGAYGFVHVMRKMIADYQGSAIIVTWDDRSARRRALYPEYKANRAHDDNTPPEKIAQREAIRWNLSLSRKLTQCLGIPSLKVPGMEADDLMAHMVRSVDGSHTIVSTDKDFYQLLDLDLSLNRGSFGENFRWGDLREAKKMTPLQYRLFHAMMGDPGDGIPGIKGVGQKTILDIISDIDDDDLHMEKSRWWDWFDGKLSDYTGARHRKIRLAIDQVRLNFELVDLLHTDLLDAGQLDTMKEELSKPVEFDSENLMYLFKIHEFESMDAQYICGFDYGRWALETRPESIVSQVC